MNLVSSLLINILIFLLPLFPHTHTHQMMNLGSEMFEEFELSTHTHTPNDHRDDCSVDDFITHMPAGSGSGYSMTWKYNGLRVFGYPGTSKFSASAGSMVDKIIRVLQSLRTLVGGFPMLLQLWTPIRCSSGGVVLTVSEQPFAIQKLCKGLCRYRYSCIRQDINVEGAVVGPIGKAFSQGYPAFYDSTSSSLSNCDFAKPYGIGKDWKCHAFPLYECDNADNGLLQQCAGVLEVFSYGLSIYNFPHVAALLKRRNIKITRLDILQCFRARCRVIKSAIDWYMLDCLREELKSLLIQIWLPCMCHTTSGSTNDQFLCTLTSMHSSFEDYDYLFLPHGSCTEEILTPLVKRACSENKTCFIRETSQLSISDYPPVHFTLSNDLKDCFVVPLKSIHPELPPLVLVVFLPRLQNCDLGNFSAQLNSPLSTVARVLSKCNAAFGLQENEEFFVSRCHSDNDNVIFFEIHRMARVAAIGHGTEDSGQDGGIPDAFVNRVTSSGESLRNSDDGISIHDITIREEGKIAAVDLPIIQEMRRFPNFNQEKQQFPPTTTLEASDYSKIMPEDTDKTSREVFANAEEEIIMDAIPCGEEVEAAAETLDGELVRSHVMLGSSIQETAGNSKGIFTFDGDEITLDMINQYRGHAKLDDAAKKLKVSRATLKRRCRKFGIERWPHYKKNEVHNIQSRQCSDNNDASDSISIPAIEKGKSITPGNHKIDQGHPLIVKAILGDEIAKFPFHSNSGIEELHRELHKRFELEVGRFKIKYKDEDEDGDTEWINLSCNEDLIFRMDTLKASEKSTMILSVFPFTL